MISHCRRVNNCACNFGLIVSSVRQAVGIRDRGKIQWSTWDNIYNGNPRESTLVYNGQLGWKRMKSRGVLQLQAYAVARSSLLSLVRIMIYGRKSDAGAVIATEYTPALLLYE